GGEKNPLGSYLIVRQSDAHAWVEAWLDERGWVRIDPTALTVPALLQGGSQVAAPLPEPGWMPPFVRAGLPALHRLQLLRDLAVMQWRRNIAAVDAEQQRAWFESLGLGSVDKAQLAAACALLVSAALGVQLLLAARARPAPSTSDARTRAGRAGVWPFGSAWRRDRQARIRQRWMRRWALGEWLLRRRGWRRAADEAPLHFLQRIALAEPRLEPALRDWGRGCLQGIYGRADPTDAPPADGRLWPLLKGLLCSSAALTARAATPPPAGRV
ncbi:MAG: transglutaminase family protein, partial [Pseudomonadota bacterium]|nr:transglutaminase family protein [Pseudomonadota bacterium]